MGFNPVNKDDIQPGVILAMHKETSYGVIVVQKVHTIEPYEDAYAVRELRFTPGGPVQLKNKATLLYIDESEFLGDYTLAWTRDEFTLEKGDVLTDQFGDYYVAGSEGKLWNLTQGTYSAAPLSGDGRTTAWEDHHDGQASILTQLSTYAGEAFSKYLG